MRLFIISAIYNLLLIFVLAYIIIFASNDIKMHYLEDISGLSEEDGVLKLSNYEIGIVYIESDKEKSTILYTKPAANDLVYENELVTVYVSKGYKTPVYKTLLKQKYSDVKTYIDDIKKEYNLNVIITYNEDDYLPDGLVIEQHTKDQFIDNNDVLELVIISNPKAIQIPNFIGWHYKDIMSYCSKNRINYEFEYVEILFPKDYAVGQSVAIGEYVLKNSNPIIIYISKEN